METKPVLSLNDLLGLHYKQIDLVHKLWNYLWLVGVTSITVAINHQKSTLVQYLIGGFFFFAIGNARLIYLSQNEARLSANAVKAFSQDANQSLTMTVKAVVEAIDPLPPRVLLAGHVVISTFVLVALVRML